MGRISELAQICPIFDRYSIQFFGLWTLIFDFPPTLVAFEFGILNCEFEKTGVSRLKDQSTKTKDRFNPDKSGLNLRFSGGCVERATPVPIPNTEVKPLGADGTARATVWESRKPPGLSKRSPLRVNLSGLFY
jgi:hypothetical protein